MTYRTPYMFAGYRADFDRRFVDAFEERRLAVECEPIPQGFDLSDPQSDE